MKSSYVAMFFSAGDAGRLASLRPIDRLEFLLCAESKPYAALTVTKRLDVFDKLIDWLASELNVDLSSCGIASEIRDALNEVEVHVLACVNMRSCRNFIQKVSGFSSDECFKAYNAYGPGNAVDAREPYNAIEFLKRAASKMLDEEYDLLMLVEFVGD